MGTKRPNGSSAWFWWALVVIVAGVMGWILWHTSNTLPKSVVEKNTNSFDVQRATNLLRWLGTNAQSKKDITLTNVAVTPPAPVVVTNRKATNAAIVIPPKTNALSTVRTNATVAKAAGNDDEDRPVRNLLEAQIALARQGISSGPIDGVAGSQTRTALRAFQKEYGLEATGDLDAPTKDLLRLYDPVFTEYVVTAADLARLHPIPDTWLEKSQTSALDFETILELVAEKHQASQNLMRSLNPSINWTNVAAGAVIKAPLIPQPPTTTKAAFVRIELSGKMLEAYDAETNLLAHFPCSIAARVEKRPAGKLLVVRGAANPNYTFDPEVFPESEEARTLGRKLIIPPGPNNPVGVAWISLDKPGYGIHGTPRPDQVGRTESHGCFRLANWNAEYLLKIVWAGLPVYVEP